MNQLLFFALLTLIHFSTAEDKEICGSQFIPPGHVKVLSNGTLYFDVPLDGSITKSFRIINTTGCRIAYSVRPQNLRRTTVDPPCGVLDPHQVAVISVFAYDEHDVTDNDKDLIVVEYTNTPKDATFDFERIWFRGDGMIRRKGVVVKYLP